MNLKGTLSDNFIKDFENVESIEDKLTLSISFMKSSLEREKEADFKVFWEAKRKALSLFKENLNPFIRIKCWKEYVELIAEAKKLKEVLEEQTSFAVDQIEMAINSIEKEIKDYENSLKKVEDIEFTKVKFFLEKKEEYVEIQRELILLNAFASRINSLRKEIIKMDMRLSIKSKFFKKLSLVGKNIFPKRKSLIKKISLKFSKDIEDFIENYLSLSIKKVPFYVLKEEIKSLQALAKVLTINTQTFTNTRLSLSSWWDKVKVLEKEKLKTKKEFYVKAKKMAEDISQKSSLKEAELKKDQILKFMKKANLSKADIEKVKKDISQNSYAFQEIDKKRKKRQEKIEKIKSKIKKLIESQEKYDIEKFTLEMDKLLKETKEIDLKNVEKQIFDRLFKFSKDILDQKKERAILSDDQIDSIEKLQSIFKDLEKRRLEVKERLEKYRKKLGESGFDIENAMMIRQMSDLEKKRLEEIDMTIVDVKGKISKLKSGDL